jgi:hypothetical protein
MLSGMMRALLAASLFFSACASRAETAEEPEPAETARPRRPVKPPAKLELAGVSPNIADAIARELAYPADLVGALRGYADACGRGDPLGCYLLGLLDRTRPVRRESRQAKILDPFETACAADDAAGCHLLALHIDDDDGGLPIDGKRALDLYGKACKLGFQPGCVRASAALVFGPLATEPGARERHDALRKEGCDAGFPSACRSAPAVGWRGDDARACSLGDLARCSELAPGPRGADAKRRLADLEGPLRVICEQARHPEVCADRKRHYPVAPP